MGWGIGLWVTSSSCSTTLLQVTPNLPDSSIYLCSMANRDPEFLGGVDSLVAYINQHQTYPAEAARAGISGRVFVSFVVSKTGDVTNVTVLKGLGYGCDEEAARLVREMPRWIPGKQNDEYVNVKFNIPILFGRGN